ncbi:MAG: hypothetical protein WAN48_06575 [Actinomycetes bacterium]
MSLIHLVSTPVEEEIAGLPTAIVLGVTVFLVFALLLFLVTRLNPDR